jgi:ergothioneine biosynthesis protein EgtB
MQNNAQPTALARYATLTQQYEDIRRQTCQLCAPLAVEDYVPQPMADVSPPKWHLAHTAWFFEELILKKFLPEYRAFHTGYSFLFNSYYEAVGARVVRAQRGHLARPTVAEIYQYRQHVDDAMRMLLEQPLSSEVADLVTLGLHHEQQHQELLLTDIKYIFGVNPLWPVYDANQSRELEVEISPAHWIEIKAGNYEIGFAGEGFCFDNEQSRHQVWLDDYAISAALVTNEEYLAFMSDGGYQQAQLWHSEGWDWVQRTQTQAPLYWHKQDGEWMIFTLSGLHPLPVAAPVCHLSFYEAAAFAEWRGLRLPTEFEWEAAASNFAWGLRWEWTNSAYLPYPRYRKAAGAVGEYNGKFMLNQMVLRGGSVVTPAVHSRVTYRNFFAPAAQWQFTGLRLAR